MLRSYVKENFSLIIKLFILQKYLKLIIIIHL